MRLCCLQSGRAQIQEVFDGDVEGRLVFIVIITFDDE